MLIIWPLLIVLDLGWKSDMMHQVYEESPCGVKVKAAVHVVPLNCVVSLGEVGNFIPLSFSYGSERMITRRGRCMMFGGRMKKSSLRSSVPSGDRCVGWARLIANSDFWLCPSGTVTTKHKHLMLGPSQATDPRDLCTSVPSWKLFEVLRFTHCCIFLQLFGFLFLFFFNNPFLTLFLYLYSFQ